LVISAQQTSRRDGQRNFDVFRDFSLSGSDDSYGVYSTINLNENMNGVVNALADSSEI